MESDAPVIYKDLPRFDGCYRVSSVGTVESCLAHRGKKTDNWRPLLLRKDNCGYLRVGLSRRLIDGKRGPIVRLVHQLILEGFVGPRPVGMECRHLDGNRSNNHIDNLAWGTPQENSDDQRRHGTIYDRRGERGSGAKLTEEQVREIFRLDSEGVGHMQLAGMMNVSPKTIEKILFGYSWTHLGLKRVMTPANRAFRERPNQRGHLHQSAKLTETQVREIRRLGSLGFGRRRITNMMNLPEGAVQGVLYGKTWRHLLRDDLLTIAAPATDHVPVRLLPVVRLLEHLRYPPLAVRQSVKCLDEGWRVAECYWLREEHRSAVEAVLPAEHGCVDGCRDCEDAARFRSGLLKGGR